MRFKRQKLSREDYIKIGYLVTIVRAILKIGTGAICFIAGEKFLVLWAVTMIVWKLNSLKEQS